MLTRLYCQLSYNGFLCMCYVYLNVFLETEKQTSVKINKIKFEFLVKYRLVCLVNVSHLSRFRQSHLGDLVYCIYCSFHHASEQVIDGTAGVEYFATYDLTKVYQ